MHEHITTRDSVKYLVGLRLAQRGVRTFAAAAARIGVSPEHLSNVLACRHRTPRTQLALARLCGCSPVELFGQFTHPTLAAPGAALKKESA